MSNDALRHAANPPSISDILLNFHIASYKFQTKGGNVSSDEETGRVPDIAKLATANGKHAQRMFTSALLRSDYHH